MDKEQKKEVEKQEDNQEDNIQKKHFSVAHEIFEWGYCILIAVVLAVLFRYFIGTPTIVKMTSMYPTLEQNQRLWLNRWQRTTKQMPERGDIITFQEPDKLEYKAAEINKFNPVAVYKERKGFEWFTYNFLEIGKASYIKRVIALPGEHVEIKEGAVYINDEKLEEPYIQSGVVTDVLGVGFNDFTVPENTVFAMGDNRNHSTDCRVFGCIPLDKIESKVAIRIWPLNLFGKIE